MVILLPKHTYPLMKLLSFLSVLRNSKSRTFEKGVTIIEEGSKENQVFFIRKGLVRCFFVNEKGDEITFQLFPEHRVVLNFHTLLFNKPSKFEFQTLERTRVYQIDEQYFQSALVKNPKLLESSRQFIFRKNLQQVYERVESFVLLSPEERYLRYCKEYPGVVNRAPDKYIASILGITPVSLSRIRKRITSKK